MYSLKPVELKTVKTYIKINLANSFIKLLKSLASALILFIQRSNGSLFLSVDYSRLNNFNIKPISIAFDWGVFKMIRLS